MSELVAKVQHDLVQAMKDKEEVKLNVLRMLKSAIQIAQTEKSKDTELTDDDVLTLVRRLIKQRHEAADLYREHGAADRADSELAEAKILEAYQPAQLGDEELAKAVAEAAAAIGAQGPKDMGKLMGKVMGAVKGKADGNRVKEQVQKYLASL
jgi:uncharacterized protein YqeY